jgi:hypothetical protein
MIFAENVFLSPLYFIALFTAAKAFADRDYLRLPLP